MQYKVISEQGDKVVMFTTNHLCNAQAYLWGMIDGKQAYICDMLAVNRFYRGTLDNETVYITEEEV